MKCSFTLYTTLIKHLWCENSAYFRSSKSSDSFTSCICRFIWWPMKLIIIINYLLFPEHKVQPSCRRPCFCLCQLFRPRWNLVLKGMFVPLTKKTSVFESQKVIIVKRCKPASVSDLWNLQIWVQQNMKKWIASKK